MFINCRRATQLISQRQERPLSGYERLQLAFHLVLCHLCRRFGRDVESLHQMGNAIARDESASSTPRLSPEVRARIRNALGREVDGTPE